MARFIILKQWMAGPFLTCDKKTTYRKKVWQWSIKVKPSHILTDYISWVGARKIEPVKCCYLIQPLGQGLSVHLSTWPGR